MSPILVFNAINTIVTDMECNIRIDSLTGQSVYPDIALHISNYYINITFIHLIMHYTQNHVLIH